MLKHNKKQTKGERMKMSIEEFNIMQNKLLRKNKKLTRFVLCFGLLSIACSVAMPFLSGVSAIVVMSSWLGSTLAMIATTFIGASAEKKYYYNKNNKMFILNSVLEESVDYQLPTASVRLEETKQKIDFENSVENDLEL